MIVLDASFLVKLVLGEEGSEKARNLTRSWAAGGEVLATLDLALPEALNALWKHSTKTGDLSPEETVNAAEDLLKVWATLRVYPAREVAIEALRLALEEKVTVYDALYIQLAKSTKAALATFDQKQYKTATKEGITAYPSQTRKQKY